MIRWFYWTAHTIVRVFAVLWLRRERSGMQHLPVTGRVVVAGNHESMLDPPLVGTAVTSRTLHYLARSTLGDVPVFGRMIEALGTLFVDREGSARAGLERAIEALERDQAVTLFPEGRRGPAGGPVADLKRGILLVVKRTRCPVVPVGLSGTGRALGRGMLLIRPAKVRVRFGAPMGPDELLAPGGLDELRRRIAELADQEPVAVVPASAVDTSPAAEVASA